MTRQGQGASLRDRAAGLRPQPPAESSQSSIPCAFTPGPWALKIDPYEDVDPPSEPFCTVTAGNGGYMGEGGFEISGICREDDARLIAAAPCLYEALDECQAILREYVREYGPTPGDDEPAALERAKATLAKARGQA